MAKKTGIASVDKDEETYAELVERSRKAKGLVGKLLSLPAGDGSAYYTVEEERGKEVRLQHHAIGDAWTDSLLGNGGWFPRKQIEPIIRAKENLDKVFADAGARQDREQERLQETVAKAALADLGYEADLYDLAHWCWERDSRRNGADARISKMGGHAPWPGDIARAMLLSCSFRALARMVEDTYPFVNLAESFDDPRVYKKAPPPSIVVLAAVGLAFEEAIGVAPQGLMVEKPASKYLTSTTLAVKNKDGVQIASVSYRPSNGAIEHIDVHFAKEKGKKVGGMESEE